METSRGDAAAATRNLGVRIISNATPAQIRVAFGALKLEQQCVWAVVKDYTAPEKDNQVHCFEDGSNCDSAAKAKLLKQ